MELMWGSYDSWEVYSKFLAVGSVVESEA
jgi:hypothetical protein